VSDLVAEVIVAKSTAHFVVGVHFVLFYLVVGLVYYLVYYLVVIFNASGLQQIKDFNFLGCPDAQTL
jgi:hypothetical protein